VQQIGSNNLAQARRQLRLVANHERAENRTMSIKKKACQTFVLDDTHKPMIGSLETHGPDAASLDPRAQQP
jgi:hypothetical protein